MSDAIELSAQTIQVGAGNHCDIVLVGPGVLPLEAEIVRQPGGELWLVPARGSAWVKNGEPLSRDAPTPLDYTSTFSTHSASLDLRHPALTRMLMSRGELPYVLGELIVGRDPKDTHIVLGHPEVSGRHATFQFPPIPGAPVIVTDHGSKGGTRVRDSVITPGASVEVVDTETVSLGPVPVPVALLVALHDRSLGGVEPSIATTLAPEKDGERPRRTSRHLTIVGTVQLGTTSQTKIGRQKDNDIVLDYPQISAHHATLYSIQGQLFLEDVGSELGTIVRGEPLNRGQRVLVERGETIQFGPLLTTLEHKEGALSLLVVDDEGWIGKPLLEVEADQLTVQVQDRLSPGLPKTILDRVSFKALPGDLIALMGPSGSGKTTLLHALSGYLNPTSGQVRINGRPLGEVFDSLRGSIGYVPQDDIIHPELTVREAVTYSASLRLPSDYTPEEIRTRVESTLVELGLGDVAHLQIGRPEAKVLSGGQRKRVNIAIELVTDPVLLLLDEPTSGLAADDTAQLVLLLERLAQTAGKTIIATIHQPARREYERFNLALVLGPSGIPLYFGPSKAAYEFFSAWRPTDNRHHVDNPRDMFAELTERINLLAESDPVRAREHAGLLFRKEYEESTVAREMAEGRRALGSPSRVRVTSRHRSRQNRELHLIVGRYTRIKLRDHVSTAILLLQAPIIGLLLGLVFGAQRPTVQAWCWGALQELLTRSGKAASSLTDAIPELAPTLDRSGAIFFLVVSAVWFGTSNAAREIVSERAIFRRESMVHLSPTNYIASKFIVLSALCCLQCTALLSIAWSMLNLSGGPSAYLVELGMMILTSLSSVALGLLLSAVVRTTEAAMALTPLALIPQVVLGGLMVPVTTVPWLRWPMTLIPARWGFEGVFVPERLAEESSPAWNIQVHGKGDLGFSDYVEGGIFRCGIAQIESSNFLGALGFGEHPGGLVPACALVATTVVLLLSVRLLLGRTGPGRLPVQPQVSAEGLDPKA
jgi:ABC transport system ATP-binding/permease protein